MTYSNDTPNPTPGYLLGNRSGQALAALYVLRVLPGVIRRLAQVAANLAANGENPDAGDRLVWVEAVLGGALAVHQEERLALLRQTPLDRTCRN